MTDIPNPRPSPADTSGERLAAYLAGDLDEVSTRAVERDLERDAALRADLERIHDVLVRLRRVDAVDVPEGLAQRVRARMRAEGATPARAAAPARVAPAPSTRAMPWWRRPVAAVAALGLLAVVAVSSLTLGGGNDEAATREAFSLDAGEVAEDRAGAAESGAAEPDGPDAAAALGPEAALPEAGGDRLEAAAATGALQPVGDLSDTATRARFLERVRDDPEVADLLAGGSRPSGWIEQARAALLAEGLPPSCAATLLEGPGRPALVLRADVEGVATVGTVTVDDGLHLTLVDPTGSCAVVVEQTG